MTQRSLDFIVQEDSRKAQLVWLCVQLVVNTIKELDRKRTWRRLEREEKRRRKLEGPPAECGIRWYPYGSGWTHCHSCGQPLHYDGKKYECPGMKGVL